jgi:hypothetical protein
VAKCGQRGSSAWHTSDARSSSFRYPSDWLVKYLESRAHARRIHMLEEPLEEEALEELMGRIE